MVKRSGFLEPVQKISINLQVIVAEIFVLQ